MLIKFFRFPDAIFFIHSLYWFPIHDFAHVFKLFKNAQFFKCPEISDKENGITLFCVPTHFVEKWKDAIPFLNKSSHVCSRPFDESDIEKGKEILNVFTYFQDGN